MEPIWEVVEGSSNIAGFAYIAGDPSADVGTLFIRFGSGSAYKYTNFPNQLAEDFFGADSKGKFFHANIRAKYVGERYLSNGLQDELRDEQESRREPDTEEELLVDALADAADELGMLIDDQEELGAYGELAVAENGQDLEDLGSDPAEDPDDISEVEKLQTQSPADEASELGWGDEGPVK